MMSLPFVLATAACAMHVAVSAEGTGTLTAADNAKSRVEALRQKCFSHNKTMYIHVGEFRVSWQTPAGCHCSMGHANHRAWQSCLQCRPCTRHSFATVAAVRMTGRVRLRCVASAGKTGGTTLEKVSTLC